jgi:hypothetical protein
VVAPRLYKNSLKCSPHLREPNGEVKTFVEAVISFLRFQVCFIKGRPPLLYRIFGVRSRTHAGRKRKKEVYNGHPLPQVVATAGELLRRSLGRAGVRRRPRLVLQHILQPRRLRRTIAQFNKILNILCRIGMPVTKLYGLEKLLLDYGVDLALWAHEHNYERHWPLYDYVVYNGTQRPDNPYYEPRAPVHITTGSAVKLKNIS